jgi:hypothetical protein
MKLYIFFFIVIILVVSNIRYKESYEDPVHKEILNGIDQLNNENNKLKLSYDNLQKTLKSVLSNIALKQRNYQDLTTLYQNKQQELITQEKSTYGKAIIDCMKDLQKYHDKYNDINIQYNEYKGNTIELIEQGKACGDQKTNAKNELKDKLDEIKNFELKESFYQLEDGSDLDSASTMSTTQVSNQDPGSAKDVYNNLNKDNDKLKNDIEQVNIKINEANNDLNNIINKINTYEQSDEFNRIQKAIMKQKEINYNDYTSSMLTCQGGTYIDVLQETRIIEGDNINNMIPKISKVQDTFDTYKKQVEYPRAIAMKCQDELKNINIQIGIADNKLKQLNHK